MRVFALAIVAICTMAFGALAQDGYDNIITDGPQEVRLTPSGDGPIVSTVPNGRRIIFREILGEYIRIDATNVAGPAWMRADGVRAAPPPLGAGRCDCPSQFRTDGRLCGQRSALCQPGGREATCDLQGRSVREVCSGG